MSNLNKKISSVPSTPRNNNQISSSTTNSVTSIIRKASNLLTQRSFGVSTNTTTASLLKNKCPPLDGEIIFSKNHIHFIILVIYVLNVKIIHNLVQH
jgi:hypothetical protein